MTKIIKKIFSSKAEKHLQELKRKLDVNGMEFLIEMMESNDDYSQHINRRPGNVTSEDSISWHAYRKADSLDDPQNISALLSLLENSKFKDQKHHIYYCLGHLCKNLKDIELFNDLMILLETDKATDNMGNLHAVSMLPGLHKFQKNNSCNIEPIKKLASEGTDYERFSALIALGNSSIEGLEDFLLEQFSFADNDTKGTVCLPLADCATEKSREPLTKAYKQTRSPGLKMLINQIFVAIDNRKENVA